MKKQNWEAKQSKDSTHSEHAYACYIKSSPRLSNSVTLKRGNQAHPQPHRRRKPRICVVDQQATTHDPCLSHSCVAPNFTRPTHMRGSPRICVESIKRDP
ncbi:hypothetical protein PIB30_101574, partial [Stylosanthes scabra]|nr:hypothetical protein [Stylosanthes scabra]